LQSIFVGAYNDSSFDIFAEILGSSAAYTPHIEKSSK